MKTLLSGLGLSLDVCGRACGRYGRYEIGNKCEVDASFIHYRSLRVS